MTERLRNMKPALHWISIWSIKTLVPASPAVQKIAYGKTASPVAVMIAYTDGYLS